MNPRLALAASVTGALLLGSTVTGTTSAAWVRQDSMPASKVTAGSMNIGTPSSPTTIQALNQSTTSVGTSTFSIADTGKGKHLVQQVAATITGRPANTTVTVQVGTTCATGGSTTTASIDKRPADASHTTTFCVRVQSSANASSGSVTLDVTGRQQPSGWSVGPKSVTIPVTVSGLTCGTQSTRNVRTFSWAPVSGATGYKVSYSATQTGVYGNSVSYASTVTTHPVTMTSPGTRWYKVEVTGPTPSTIPGWITMERLSNEGNSNMSCAVVTTP